MNKAGGFNHLGGVGRDFKTHRVFRNLRRTGNNAFGVANTRHNHHRVHPGLGNGDRCQRIGFNMIGNRHYIVGIFRVRKGIA